MKRNRRSLCFLVLLVAGFAGCSSKPPEAETKKAVTLDKIQGKAQIILTETTSTDNALNAGGQSVYIWEGVRRYRLFFKNPAAVEGGKVEGGKEYAVEGIDAQKAIDEIGDPDQGKEGYPLQASCERVIKMAWSGLSFETTGVQASVLRTRVKRYPARPVLLVTKLTPAEPKPEDVAAAKKEAAAPEVAVPADKQKAQLEKGPTTLTAPLWEPAGKTVSCKVIIGSDGKITELETGDQLCEAVPWAQFSYKPTLKGGKPARVKTEVEVKFEARK